MNVRSSLVREVLTPIALARLALGWGSVAALTAVSSQLGERIPTLFLWIVLAAIVAIILVCAFGVVREAEHLARQLGDPYGSLVLTLSIVVIEVILISAVMLGPGEHLTIGRDSVMAVSMIILNLVVGVSLIIGGLRGTMPPANGTGVSMYLVLLIFLIMLAFALPGTLSDDGQYPAALAIPVAILTVAMYAFFLVRQMGPQAADFQDGARPKDSPPVHRPEVLARLTLLIVTVLPIVLLSHHMASLLDDGLERAGAPIALSGLLIAAIVFLPETLTTLRAARSGETQRVSNLCHGALVSTVGLTIPAVLVIGLLTGQPVVLAETPVNLLLLAASLGMTAVTFLGPRQTAVHGAAHVALFVVYVLTIFT